MVTHKFIQAIGFLLFAGFMASAQAGIITCGDNYRKASLSSAESCNTQILGSTIKQSTINALYGDNWTQVGQLTSGGSNNFLSITGWTAASGTWAINPDFWQEFGLAVITMHVGGGQKNAADNFEWIISPETLTGDWSYQKLSGKGGGLSNIKLWGAGTPIAPPPPPPVVKVSEPNSMILLLAGLILVLLGRSQFMRKSSRTRL
jgi:hypothetical protein